MEKKTFPIIVVFILLVASFYYFRASSFSFKKRDALSIVSNIEATDISPYALSANGLTRIQNIYEGLVAFDPHLKAIPSLAVSWGNTSNTSWEFYLRQGVKFHDGILFTGQDVIEAWTRAKNSQNPLVAGVIDSILTMNIDGDKLLITTSRPDPLLLSKLTKLFVTRDNNVGTGPYKLVEWIPENRLVLEAFEDYWGKKPFFKDVRYEVISSQKDREQLFAGGKIDLLLGITEDQALKLPKNQIISAPGLEVNFLMFRMMDAVFKDRAIRTAIMSVIDPKKIEKIGNDFIKPVNQFLAPGVFGYNPTLRTFGYDPQKEVHDVFGKRMEKLNFDYLNTYEPLGQYLSEQLKKVGFSVNAEAHHPEELLSKIRNNQSPLFLVGWLAEDGDAGNFYDAFIHSEGPFNRGRYKNEEVDRLIEKSRTEMDPRQRLALLQEIGAIVNRDFIGIPLFETSQVYALGKNIQWEPRVDGAVLAGEIETN